MSTQGKLGKDAGSVACFSTRVTEDADPAPLCVLME